MSARSQSETDADRLVTALDALHCDGFVILRDRINPADLAQIRHDLDPLLLKAPRCEGDFYGWKTTRLAGLLDKVRGTQDLALSPEILAIVAAMLSPQADCFQLNLTEAIRIHPGERAQVPHRDEEMWPAAKGGKEWLLNVMWAIDDFTPENGATRLWPGSHEHTLDRSIDPAMSIPAVMDAGSALIYLGSLTHGAGANRSQAPRTGIVISYCLGWLKQYENQFLTYGPEVVRTFPRPLQRLIGYQMHRPNLGGVGGQDPMLALENPGALRGHKDSLPPDIAAELASFHRSAEA